MATTNVHEALDNNFQEAISNTSVPVLVDFWAPWCGPCRTLGPIIEEFAHKNIGKVKVIKVNVDEAGETAAKFGIRSIPTVIVLKNGVESARKVGVGSASDYLKMIE